MAKMVVLCILALMIGLFLLYALLFWLCGVPVDIKKEYTDHSPFYRWLLNFNSGLWMKLLRIRVHVTGLEQVPRHKKVLFVGNHISNYDPILTWLAFKNWNMAFISKPSNFKIPFFGPAIRRCGFLAIDRENPRNAIVTINKAAALIGSGLFSVGVYPEGTRSKTGQLLPFHNGVFKIAQKSEADIVVLSIAGTEKIHRNVPFRRSDVYLDVVGVLPAETIKKEKTEAIGETVRQLLLSKRKERI